MEEEPLCVEDLLEAATYCVFTGGLEVCEPCVDLSRAIFDGACPETITKLQKDVKEYFAAYLDFNPFDDYKIKNVMVEPIEYAGVYLLLVGPVDLLSQYISIGLCEKFGGLRNYQLVGAKGYNVDFPGSFDFFAGIGTSLSLWDFRVPLYYDSVCSRSSAISKSRTDDSIIPLI